MNRTTDLTLRIQLIAIAPGRDLLCATPTEFKRVRVVKTLIAPPKKCYNKQEKQSLKNREQRNITLSLSLSIIDSQIMSVYIHTFKALHFIYGTYDGVTLSGKPSGTTYDLTNDNKSCTKLKNHQESLQELKITVK